MADLSITNIEFRSSVSLKTLLLGEACSAYDVVYQDSATKKYMRADATDTIKAKATHILTGSGGLDKYVPALPLSALSVDLTGPTMTQGEQYVVSVNAGKVAPRSDLVTGNIISNLWSAESATAARIRPDMTSIAVP